MLDHSSAGVINFFAATPTAGASEVGERDRRTPYTTGGGETERGRIQPATWLCQMTCEPQRILGKEVEKVWEGQRWWVGGGWCAETHRFVPDGQQDGGAWKCTKDALAPSLDGLVEKAAVLKAKLSGTEAAAVRGLTDGLLDSANASLAGQDSEYGDLVRVAGSPCHWRWSKEPWRVARDGGTDREGWTYATDWARLATTREGGRKSQRNSDVVRRRCLFRPRVLVATGPGAAPAELAAQLGDSTVSLLDAIADLEQMREAEEAAEKEHTKRVLGVVLDLTKTHVFGRRFADQPLDPTAWYRLAKTHSVDWCQTIERRPPVTDAEVPLLRDLVRAMRFANGAYGFAAEQMVSVKSNVKMHASRLLGGVDAKDGVEDAVNSASLCKLAEIPTSAILYSRWAAGPHSPACFLAAAAPRTAESYCEGEAGWLVLGIRGTLNVHDALCDVDAAEVGFLGGKAHQGFASAAESLCAELQETLLAACADPRYAGYELVVTGHSLGGCASEALALKLRELGREKALPMLEKARCLSFAGGAAATPELQQSEESQELTVCVVYGDDIVPRLGAASVCTLLDELCEHGVAAIALRKLGRSAGAETQRGGEAGTDTADLPEGEPPSVHSFRNFPMWIGLPDDGNCRACGVKRWKPGDSKYCERCFVCENCCTQTNRVTECERARTGARARARTEPEPEPAPASTCARPTQLALGGRVIWIDPDFSSSALSGNADHSPLAAALPHLRWAEWQDLTKIVASSKMIVHHLPLNYLTALEIRLAAALGLPDPTQAMSELTRAYYEEQRGR